MVNVLKRAKELNQKGISVKTTPTLDFFIQGAYGQQDFHENSLCLNNFLKLDDSDIVIAIKMWSEHKDSILSDLCKRLANRNLLKVKFIAPPENLDELKNEQIKLHNLTEEEIPYYFIYGSTSNKTYTLGDENIKIVYKSGEVKEISQVEHSLISEGLLVPIKKHYICLLRPF